MKQPSTQALAAKAIKQYMKTNDIAGRVTSTSYAGGCSASAYVTDLPPDAYKKLCDFAKQYQYGSFNSMEDIYEYSNSRKDIPQVKYVFVNNLMSDELKQEIWEFILNTYSGMEGAPANASDAYNFRNNEFDEFGSQLIYRLFSGGYNNDGFWKFYAIVEKAAA